MDLGLICHLKDYEQHIKNICELSENLVIETAVCDSADDNKYFEIYENKYTYDLSFNGIARIPSAKSIEKILSECGMKFERVDCDSLNCNNYNYSWSEINNNQFNPINRRLWFCKKENSKLNTQENKIQASFKENNMDKNIKPRVALCISGYLRTFGDTFKNLEKHILLNNNCDIFIHTWDTNFDNQKSFKDKIDENYILSTFNPKKIIIEKPKNFNLSPIMHKQNVDNRNINNVLSMLYKIKKCNDLKNEYENQKNIKYDATIRYRSDILMKEDLLIRNIENNSIYFPEYGNFGGICDQMAFGNTEMMNIYSSLFDKIENYLYEGLPLNPEKLLLHHIKSKSIKINRFFSKFVLLRKNNQFQDNILLEKKFGFIK